MAQAALQSATQKIVWLQTQPVIVRSLVEVLIILVIVMVACALELLIYRRLLSRSLATSRLWDDVLLKALHRPLQLLILVVGLCYCIDVFDASFTSVSFLAFTNFIRKIIVIFTVLWAALRFGKGLECNILDPSRHKKVDKATAFAVNRLFRIAAFFIGAIAIMQLVGVPFSALLAFGGAGALAFSFAAKDSLANVFGGLMLYIEHPFAMGDWILIIDKNIEGVVDGIGWRSTRIINFDKRPIFVPNSVFTTSSVMNCTRMANRRMVTALTLRYQDADKIPAIRDEVYEYIRNHHGIDPKQAVQVFFNEFGDSSINIRVAAFSKTTDSVEFGLLQQEIYLKMIDIVTRHGADFAFPTQTLDVPKAFTMTVPDHT
ncbi:MAG: mechanosensitive ion channel protein MscS [Gammaproteobacteria bacterium CG11_big_fil_rev_8_21_14_0_20_46_22]|nr:MAG: mechanosensitive ion channel protein MscS [Gammaproteobacteria bacterium CG12_big_fil_rev_8_21_14_0_65_46_12]PIR11922.1 MAG: mechanosensitive ion channel protein MscS [Gammaproteobacteria bacterium CG11_big_fil_rev_8_21_14_0_20_46_22]